MISSQLVRTLKTGLKVYLVKEKLIDGRVSFFGLSKDLEITFLDGLGHWIGENDSSVSINFLRQN